jgi:hypothetical protein
MTAEPDKTPLNPAENRRRAARVRALKNGTIVFNNGYSTYDCVIRNLSATGAMLVLSGGFAVPDTFELRMDAPQPPHRCAVRWRGADRMGVSFDD